jgi:lysine 2,3-aminomutase
MKSDLLISTSVKKTADGATSQNWSDWRWQFRHRIRTIDKLYDAFGGKSELPRDCRKVTGIYPLAVTPYYLSLIQPSDPADPILRQCFPDIKELTYSTGGTADPLDEDRHMQVPGLIHRYPDRCLVIMTNVCATYCRHCNRKRIWKTKSCIKDDSYAQRIIDCIASRPSIREVILSGGDPLTLSDRVLDSFLSALRTVRHVEIIRIGSRIPVVLPMRITPELCSILKRHRPVWLNSQFNHPREITRESTRACEMLTEAGIPVSNQTVLLRGINDDYDTMRDLLYGLQKISVRPYYLFQCDPVQGTDHFRTDIWRGMEIMEKLWKNVSGLCIPRYVLDVPGGKGKIPLQPFSMSEGGNIEKS